MEKKDYQSNISVNATPAAAYDAICRVADWWASSFRGASRWAGDGFSVRFGKTTVDFRVVEAIPERKLVWLVTDCHLDWLEHKKEWKDTRISWEIMPGGKQTRIDMTHVGLVPEAECYNNCREGWDFYVKESLFKLLNEGKGVPHEESTTKVA